MAKTEKINISLPEKLADYLHEQVHEGHFHTKADAVRYAIRIMQNQSKNESKFNIDEFIQAGIDSGLSSMSGTDVHKKLGDQIREVRKSQSSR